MQMLVEENEISEVRILVEKAKAVLDTVAENYFNQKIESKEDCWRLGVKYKNNCILVELVDSLLYDAQQLLDKTTNEAIKQ